MSVFFPSSATFGKPLALIAACLVLSGCFQSSEERAQEHLQNGIELAQAGDLPRALVEFRNTIELDESNLEAYRQMARANLGLDRYQDAYASYLRLVEATPDDVEGRLALSELAFLARNWDEFVRHGGRLVMLSPDAPKAQAVRLGLDYRTALNEANAAEGQAILAKAETLAEDLPDNAILRRIRIDAYIADGKLSDALALVDDAIAAAPQDPSLYSVKLQLLARLGDEAGLEAELRNMLEVFPDDRQAKDTYLRYLLSRDRTAEAQDFLRELFETASGTERNDAFITLIQFIRQRDGIEAAVAEIDAALAKEETPNTVWQVLRGSLVYDLGRRDEGIAAVEAVLEKEEELPPQERFETKIVLAQMLATNSNEVGARQQIEEVLAADPNNARALKIRAGWLISEDETEAAINDLRLALDQAPEDTDAMVLMSRAYERAGNRDLMLSYLATAAETSNNAPRYALPYARALAEDEKFLEAEGALISSLRIVPGNVDVLTTLGSVYLQLEDLGRAAQVVETLKEIETDSAQSNANQLEAEVTLRRLGVDQALEFLETQASQSDADDAFSKLVLIQARLRAGKTDEARRFAQSVVDEAPDNLQLRNALALSHAAARDFAAAEAEFEAILEVRPDAVPIYLQLARLRGAQGQAQAARETIDQGLAEAPEAPDLLWAKASYLQQEGNIDAAIDIYEGLYTRNSDNLVIANNLASLLATYRDDEASLERAERIARRLQGTEIAAFQDTYGWILHRRGKSDEALGYLEPAALGLPGDPIVQLHLGEIYAALERPENALEQMRRALEAAGPLADDALRSRIQARIDALQAGSEN